MADGRRANELGELAEDAQEIQVRSNGGDWVIFWSRPGDVPAGTPHGANAFCVSENGSEVVLISPDGERWGWPGGRPEPGESWEDVVRREVREEACSVVITARLLGFVRASCTSGAEAGATLVRSIWRTVVRIDRWEPRHEVQHRDVIPVHDLARRLWMEDGFEPIYARAAYEADLLPLLGAGSGGAA